MTQVAQSVEDNAEVMGQGGGQVSRTKLVSSLLAMTGGVGLAVASWLLPWFNLEDTSITKGAIVITGSLARSGWDTLGFLEFGSTKPMGFAVIACGVLAIAVAAVILLRPAAIRSRTLGAGLVGAAIVALAITLYSIANPPGVHYGSVTIVNYPVVVTPGGGSLAAIAASILLAVTGTALVIADVRSTLPAQAAASSPALE